MDFNLVCRYRASAAQSRNSAIFSAITTDSGRVACSSAAMSWALQGWRPKRAEYSADTTACSISAPGKALAARGQGLDLGITERDAAFLAVDAEDFEARRGRGQIDEENLVESSLAHQLRR